MSETLKRGCLLMVCGLCAGIVNGLLGAGSGVIVVFGLEAALGGRFEDGRELYVNATAVILIISLFSVVSYFRRGALPPTELGRYLLPGVVGGLVGATLLEHIRPEWVRRIFSVVVMISGLAMILR